VTYFRESLKESRYFSDTIQTGFYFACFEPDNISQTNKRSTWLVS